MFLVSVNSTFDWSGEKKGRKRERKRRSHIKEPGKSWTESKEKTSGPSIEMCRIFLGPVSLTNAHISFGRVHVTGPSNCNPLLLFSSFHYQQLDTRQLNFIYIFILIPCDSKHHLCLAVLRKGHFLPTRKSIAV